MESVSNYKKFRGKCKEFCDELMECNPSFQLVRGYYYEPLWNREEPHWWCVDECGAIHDPTKLQFPSGGISEFYREFDGTVDCEECGLKINEGDIVMQGRYPVCSAICAMKLVGIYNQYKC